MAANCYGTNWAAIDRCVGQQAVDPVHPGELLTDWLDSNQMTQHELATALGVTDPYLGMIRSGSKTVGPRAALKLEVATGVRAEVWLHLQMAHTLAKLRAGSDA